MRNVCVRRRRNYLSHITYKDIIATMENEIAQKMWYKMDGVVSETVDRLLAHANCGDSTCGNVPNTLYEI